MSHEQEQQQEEEQEEHHEQEEEFVVIEEIEEFDGNLEIYDDESDEECDKKKDEILGKINSGGTELDLEAK